MMTKPKKARIVSVLLALCTLICLTGCQRHYVNALDYGLEDALYTQQQELDGLVSPTPDMLDGTSSTPAIDPFTEPASPTETPALPTDAPTVQTPAPTAGQEPLQPTQTPAEQAEPPATPPAPPTPTSGSPMPTPTPISMFQYTLYVLTADNQPLPKARISMYENGELLYTAITGGNGEVEWSLRCGGDYRATAKLDGYTEQSNQSDVSGAQAAITAYIYMEADVAPTPVASMTPEPTPSIIPVPTPYDGGKVSIHAPDVEIAAGDASFGLLDGVFAVDASGDAVEVWIASDDWFNVHAVGEYIVVYAAMQGSEPVFEKRTVRIVGESKENQQKPTAPSGSSNERYNKLLTYRNEIYGELAPRMQELAAQLRAYTDSLYAGGENVTYLREVALYEDDSVDETDAALPIKTVGFTETDQVSVSNWPDILAVFIVKNTDLEVEDPLDLMSLRNIQWDGLEDVFGDMFKLAVRQTDTGTEVLLSAKSYEDMATEYGFNEQQTKLLYTLMQPEFQKTFASLTGNAAFDDMTQKEIRSVLAKLPDGLSADREQVVKTAYSLVGQVSYFWGGKSNALGWNEGWGLPHIVTSQGSKTSGKERAFGLDCSGFVSWTFINAAGNAAVLETVGNGSTNQWNLSTSIGWDQGEPGDLAFLAVPGERAINHIGIIVAVEDDGSYMVAHCSSSKGGVVVTDAWNSGFRYLRRPIIYGE